MKKNILHRQLWILILSGLLTACVAAGKGKKVTVLSYGAGTLTIGGGIVDFIGYDDNAQPVKNPLAALNEINPEHPYAKVGKAVASAAFNDFKKITENEGYAYLGDVKKNRWVPTAVGSFKPTCLVPKTMDTDALKSAKEVLVVGVNGLKDFYAKLVAKNFTEENIIQKVLVSELSSVHTKELINIYPAKAAPDKNPSITDLI